MRVKTRIIGGRGGGENRVPVGRTDCPLYQTTVSPQSFAPQCQQCMFRGSTTAVDRGKMLAYDPQAGNFVVANESPNRACRTGPAEQGLPNRARVASVSVSSALSLVIPRVVKALEQLALVVRAAPVDSPRTIGSMHVFPSRATQVSH